MRRLVLTGSASELLSYSQAVEEARQRSHNLRIVLDNFAPYDPSPTTCFLFEHGFNIF